MSFKFDLKNVPLPLSTYLSKKVVKFWLTSPVILFKSPMIKLYSVFTFPA